MSQVWCTCLFFIARSRKSAGSFFGRRPRRLWLPLLRLVPCLLITAATVFLLLFYLVYPFPSLWSLTIGFLNSSANSFPRGATTRIDTAHGSRTEKFLVFTGHFYNHVHAVRLIWNHRCTLFTFSDHDLFYNSCVTFVASSFLLRGLSFRYSLHKGKYSIWQLRNNEQLLKGDTVLIFVVVVVYCITIHYWIFFPPFRSAMVFKKTPKGSPGQPSLKSLRALCRILR